jgi:hypothetical protein
MIYLSLLLKSPAPLTVLKAARGKGALCYLAKIMVRKLKSCSITLIIVVLLNPYLKSNLFSYVKQGLPFEFDFH